MGLGSKVYNSHFFHYYCQSQVRKLMSKLRKFFQYLFVIVMLLFFIFSMLVPMIIDIFYGYLPYLNRWSLLESFIFCGCIWFSLHIVYLILSTKDQKNSVLSTLNYKSKEWLGVFLDFSCFLTVELKVLEMS